MNDETLFHEALKRPLAERESFLREACGNDEACRQRVATLLKAHEHPAGFLAAPCVPPLGEGATAAADAGSHPENASLDFLEPSERADSLGRLGHYEILSVVGRGGFGVVLRAFDEKLHRVVAIKVLSAPLAALSSARRRFAREAQAAAAVSHDNIVRIYAVEEAPVPYLVMEFVEGISLDDKLKQHGPLELREVLRIGLQIAEGLAAAHKQGLVHRDVKPANILLENGIQRVKITDFGLARAVDDVSLTQSGVIAGTPLFMSPEQARGEPVDARSDLFSLGSVLYALCAGQPPFRGSTTLAVIKRVCEESPRPIRELNRDVPPWLIQTIDRLLAKQPAERFQSAGEVAELLGQKLALLQQPSTVGQVSNLSTSTPAGSGPRRRLWVAAAAVVIFFLAAALLLTESAGITHLAAFVFRTPTQQDDSVVKAGSANEKSTNAGSSAANEKDSASTASAPPAVDPSKPFVILTRDGKTVRTCATLADALLNSLDGDTIEIRANGPFEIAPLRLKSGRVIRAGQGFQPVVRVVVPGRIAPGEPRSLESLAPLVLEGLEFQITGPDPQRVVVAVNAIGPGSIHVANCRFSGCQFLAQHLSDCQVRNCLVLGGAITLLDNRPSLHAVIENNVAVRPEAAPFNIKPGPTEQRLKLARNVLIGRSAIGLNASVRIADDPHPLQIQASQNILVGRPCAVHFNVGDVALPAEWTQGSKAEELLRKAISWNEEQNLYSVDASYLSLGHGPWLTAIKPTRSYRTLADWNQFWNAQDATSIAGAIRFAAGDVFARQNELTQLTPADFRLRTDSAGYRAGEDGQDLGPDIDLVGPGPAYERWKKSQKYQEWLKETGQLARQASQPEPQSFVVLGGCQRGTRHVVLSTVYLVPRELLGRLDRGS